MVSCLVVGARWAFAESTDASEVLEVVARDLAGARIIQQLLGHLNFVRLVTIKLYQEKAVDLLSEIRTALLAVRIGVRAALALSVQADEALGGIARVARGTSVVEHLLGDLISTETLRFN